MDLRGLATSAAMPVLDGLDYVVRRAQGRSDLPPFSLRARTSFLSQTLGGRAWVEKGEQIVQELKHFCGLRRDHDVLEIGCASGIAAIPLRSVITSGTYMGIDIIPELIEWCRKHVATERFRFVHADVLHQLYNPGGTMDPERVALPIPEESFDVVFLISVFTHFLPPTAEHYFKEIHRVLRRRGKCLITMLTKERYNPGRSVIPLRYVLNDDCLCWDLSQPTKAVAFSGRLIERLAVKARLRIHTMAPGSWDGQTTASYLHDMYVFERSSG